MADCRACRQLQRDLRGWSDFFNNKVLVFIAEYCRQSLNEHSIL